MIKKVITLLSIGILNSAFAESTVYDTTTNTMTIPFVQLNNHNFSNVTFTCDPADNHSCRLLGAIASDCARGIYEGDIGQDIDNTYSIHTRSAEGIQYGGILLSNPDGREFTASWIKSSKDKNPYLFGQDLSQFSDNTAYGVIGGNNTSADFELGDLITVTGDSTGYFIEQVNGDATATFNKGTNVNVHNSCNSLTGDYIGDIGYSSKNIYSINILNNTDGSIQLKDPDGFPFTASWDGTEKLFEKYSIATLGNISSSPYPQFSEDDKAFVTDIGNGIVLTVIDAFTGKVSTTAVFIERQ